MAEKAIRFGRSGASRRTIGCDACGGFEFQLEHESGAVKTAWQPCSAADCAPAKGTLRATWKRRIRTLVKARAKSLQIIKWRFRFEHSFGRLILSEKCCLRGGYFGMRLFRDYA
jgi:hypothetical protein